MEYIDIVDSKTGEKTGEVATHQDVHIKGLWHRTVHLWIVNSKGEILLQRRAESKKNYPDMWDISAAGHISTGENPIEAARRETLEEIGLDIPKNKIEFLGTIAFGVVLNNGTYIDNEFKNIYLVKIDIYINQLSLQKEELKDLKWIKISEFKEWVDQKKADLVPNEKEHRILLKYLLEAK